VRAPLGSVRADPDRLRIALRNLLRNAIQHRRACVPLEITVRSWRRGARLTLTLSDNGAGLPASERARLRGPLRPGRSSSGGLGLAIARAAIEASGGGLAAMSRAGLGTTFAITLPVAAEKPAGRASSAERPGERIVKRRRAAAQPPTLP
jgi:signal transduction histidine kinase